MVINDTTPDNGDVGIPLEQTISVVFDEEVDLDTILTAGNFVVVSSADKLTSRGPGFEDWSPTDDDLLDSQVFTGFIEGEITTSDSLTFVFTPTVDLEPNKTYRVILGTKLTSRTINAIAPDGGNTSTGSFTTVGPYTGAADPDTWTIDIASGGLLGTATFTYTRTSTGLTSEAIPTDRSVELEDGVFLNFTAGTFVVADQWVFVSQPGTALAAITEFSFATGSSSHVEVSEDTPSLRIQEREVEGILRIDQVPAVDSSTLALVSIEPDVQDSNVPTSRRTIILTFNKPIDAASLTTATIEVLMESLPLDESQRTSTALRVTPTVSGSTLTLTFTG
jgi:hypothetical protein